MGEPLKKALKYTLVASLILFTLLIAAVLFITHPSTHTRVGRYLIQYLKNEYGLQLDSEDFAYDFEKGQLRIRMKDVRIYGGQSNNSIFFQTKKLEALIPYSSFRGNHFLVSKVILDTTEVNPENLPRLRPKKSESKNARTFEIQQIDLKEGQLRYQKLPIQDIDLYAQFRDNNINVTRLNARFDTIAIEASGEIKNLSNPEYILHYDTKGNLSSIRKVVEDIPPLRGPFHSTGEVSGKSGFYVVDGTVQSDQVYAYDEQPFPINGTYRYDSSKSIDPLTYKVEWKDAPATLAHKLEADVPLIAAATAGSFEFHGGKKFWEGAGKFDVRLDSNRKRGIPLDGQVTGVLQNGLIRLSESTLRTGSTRVRFQGDLSPSQMALNLNANVQNPASLSFLTPQLKKVPGSYLAKATIRGPYSNLQVLWNLQGTAPEVQLISNGSYRVASKQIAAEFQGHAEAKALDSISNAKWNGTLEFEGKASGSVLHPNLEGFVKGNDLTVNDRFIGEANVNIQSDGKLLTADAQIPFYSSNVQGTYHFASHNFDVRADAQQLDLAALKPLLPPNAQEVEGTFTATLNASGNMEHWKDSEAHVVLERANLKYREFDVAIENAIGDLRDGIANVQLQAQSSHGNFQVQGDVPVFRESGLNLNLDGETDVKFVSAFYPEVQASGPVSVQLHLGGTFQKPDYSGHATAENFSVQYPDPPIALTNAKMTAGFSGAEVSLSGSGNLNGSTLNVEGRVPMVNKSGFVHVTVDNFPVASLATQANVRGNISVDLDAHGIGRDPERWTGFFKIVPSQLVVSGHPIEASQPLELEMTSGAVRFRNIRLKSGEYLDMEAQGEYNFRTDAIQATLRNSMDLSLISSFMTNAAAEGKVLADVRIAGTSRKPDLQGEVQVENGMFRKFESPILLEQIQLRAPLNQDGIRIETFTARMGGGSVEGGGTIRLKDWKPQAIDLKMTARNVGMNYPEALRSQLNADLTMANQETDFLVSGKVQVIRSTYREDIDPRDRLVNSLLSEKRALSSGIAAQGRIRFDVAVETLDDFQMRNNLGKVQAGLKLQMRGLVEEPRIFGRIQVRERSEIYFEGNRFEVRRGTIDFYGQRRLNPVFDVELFTIATDMETRQDYEITIPLSGELRDLDRRDPTSFPPLAANQIYFLLLTGRADAQLGSASSRFLTQQLASFAAGQIFSGFTRDLAKGFGLDRVEIQPEMLASETNPGAKLVVGKDFTSSLSLLYSVSLTEAQEQTWIANYRAPKNLSFRFVDQAEGSYTANMRHLIRFGEGVSTGTLRPPKSRKISIQKIELENDSILTNEEVLGELGLQDGDTYDFWSVQDKLDDLEKTLQDRGILFSATQSDEVPAGSNEIVLKLRISGKERRDMIFEGWDVSQGQLDQYRQYWREGFSPSAVTEIIRENVLRELWRKGYHKAEITKQISENNGVILHKFVIQPGPLFTESQIQFLQAEQYPAEELEEDLRALYENREDMMSDAFHNTTRMERKIVALYVRRGFLDSSVESGSTTYSGDVAVKEMEVLEGTQSKIAALEFTNNEHPPEDLMKRLKSKPGVVYDPSALLEDEIIIGDYYERLGYRTVRVESSIEKSEDGLVAQHDLKKGEVATIDSIEIKGADMTKESLILKRLEFKEGEILNQDKIAQGQKNLTDLRIFHQVTIRDIPSQTDPGRYHILVDLIERNHYEFTYGFRYDTETDLGGEVQLTDLNLFGTGQSVSFYTRIHQQDQLYRILYHSPTLSGLRWKTLISTSYERGNLLLLQDEKFDGERFDFTIQRQKELGNDFMLIPGYQFEYLTVTPLETTEFEPVEGMKISRFIGTLFRDTRNDPFNATRGSFFSIDAQAGLGFIGDVSYVKSYNQYLRFRPFKRFLWASAVRVGLATDLPPRIVTERFFAGGSFSMRGFKRDQVGPKLPDGTPAGGEALFILNQEIRFPVWKWFGGVVFYDGGNVYSGVGDFNPFDIRHSIGIGLRLNSPFGIARLDYGINLDPEENEPRGVLHFAIGQAF